MLNPTPPVDPPQPESQPAPQPEPPQPEPTPIKLTPHQLACIHETSGCSLKTIRNYPRGREATRRRIERAAAERGIALTTAGPQKRESRDHLCKGPGARVAPEEAT